MVHISYGNNKPKYIRYVIYAFVLIVAAVLQNCVGGLNGMLGIRAFLLLPAVVCIAMFEREVAASLFGVFAGVLWDINVVNDGFNCIVLFLICAVCSLLISHFMRNNVITATVMGVGAVTVYIVIYVLFNYVFASVLPSTKQIFTFFLPSGLFTLVFVPLCYFLVSHIYEAHKTSDE